MQNHEAINCDFLVNYLTGEYSELELAAFEEHLRTCDSCRNELRDIRQVWNALPFEMDELEVPPDLKPAVMKAIHKPRNIRSFTWIYKIAAAVLIGVVIGALWNNAVMHRQRDLAVTGLNRPAEVLKSYDLKTADSSMPTAKGTAFVLQNGDSNMIVVNMWGLAETIGNQAYQVWLIHNGKRYNCGTVHVDKMGKGVLTYGINAKNLGFEGIGVTLEPDPNGSQPRGRKILGT